MNNEELLPFDEGLPTRPDVDLLLATWPAPKAGDRFPYESIEKLLSISRSSVRFRTITNVWRKRLTDLFGVVVYAETDIAFYCATAAQVIARTYPTLAGIGRKAKHHRRDLVTVKHETEEQRVVIEHQARLALALERDVKKQRMNLLPPTATPEAPRIQPPAAPPEPADRSQPNLTKGRRT